MQQLKKDHNWTLEWINKLLQVSCAVKGSEKFSINSTDTYLCCLQPLKSKNTKKDFYFIFHEVERIKNN